MGTIIKRQRCRRRLAAFSFLSNISLDGTHRDTKLGTYNLSLQTDSSRLVSDTSKSKHVLLRNTDSWKHTSLSDVNQTEAIDITDDALNGLGSLHATKTSPRERVHSFVSETKSKFLNPRKKNIAHSIHEQCSVTACSSTESIGLCLSSQTSNTISDSVELKFLRSPKVFQNQRIVLLSSGRVPFLVFSSLAYDKKASTLISRSDSKQEGNRRRQTSGSTRALAAINDEADPFDILSAFCFSQAEEGQDVSYGCLLANPNRKYRPHDSEHLAVPCPHMNRCHSFDPSASNVHVYNKQPTTPTCNVDRGFDVVESKYCHHSTCLVYTPNLLDDPELVTGKHSTVLTFSSYIASIIDYVKPSDLKKELNEKFKERFPLVQLTLSKLRSLKKEMFKITHLECGVDLLTLAQAYVFFEKLILKLLINKQNRKFCAAACVLLSAKLNDVKGQDLKNLMEKLECGFRLNHRDFITAEFRVLVTLEFSLHLPTWEVFPHYQRLLYES